VLFGGFFFLFLGILAIALVSLRDYASGADLLSWSTLLVGVCSLGLAAYFLLWALLTRRSLAEEEQELAQENRELELLNSLKD
jgi:membrane protein implicated in regulation of membrane protease activity